MRSGWQQTSGASLVNDRVADSDPRFPKMPRYDGAFTRVMLPRHRLGKHLGSSRKGTDALSSSSRYTTRSRRKTHQRVPQRP
jgi:hypothetical protein